MQLSKGVEWVTHACTMLAPLPEGRGLSVDALAAFYEVPPAYLAKQMQALRKAGIAASVRGKSGGYRLARPAQEVTLLNIVLAIEGPMPAFRCTEIRQNGPCALRKADCRKPCEIASAFAAAESAWRKALAETSIADIMQDAVANADPDRLAKLGKWIAENA